MVCHFFHSSVNGFPPCHTACCKDGYVPTSEFLTSNDDGVGLLLMPEHYADGGFVCARCQVRAQLKRDVHLADARSVRCHDLEIQRLIDVQHATAPSTWRSYRSSVDNIRRFGVHNGIDFYASASPPPPPFDLAVCFAWYALDAMCSGGRRGAGRSMATIEAHRSAYSHWHRMYAAAPADAPTASPVFASWLKGAGRRVHYNSQQAWAMTVRACCALQSLFAARVTTDPDTLRYGDPLFAPVFDALAHASICLVCYMGALRGNEPYKIRFRQVQRDRVLGADAARLKCTAHYLFNMDGTKSSKSQRATVPIVARSLHGLRLGDFLQPYIRMRLLLPTPLLSPAAPLFVHVDGSKFNSAFFLTQVLRPAALQLQCAPSTSGLLRNVDVSSSVTTNSFRRGGNTAAANALVPKYLRMGHCRWKNKVRMSADMEDLYDEVGIETRLRVSYCMCDERLLSSQFGSATSPLAKRLFDSPSPHQH